MSRLPFLLSLFLLAACAAVPPVSSPVTPVTRAHWLDTVLAPFEDPALLPPEVALLPYAGERAYALLVQLPSPAIVDLSAPQRAHRGLVAFLDPLAVRRAGTALGHVMAGWRCADGQAGLVSKTGDIEGRGYRMLRRGWGLGALLATYDDGHLVTLAAMPEPHRRALRRGRARIVAMEITEEGCQRMRRALAEYLARPAAEQARYSMVATQANPRGEGCAGFALRLTDRAGATSVLSPWLMRDVTLRDSFVGLGRAPVPGVAPLSTGARAPLPILRLLLGDWSSGAEVGTVRLLDLELLQRALEEAKSLAGHARPLRLPMADPTNAVAQAAILRWLEGWHRVTPVRMGVVRAVVLHRR